MLINFTHFVQIYDWRPEPYLKGDDIPEEIKNRHSPEYIGISCEGKVGRQQPIVGF